MLSTKPMLLKRTTTKGFSAEIKIIYDEPSGVTFMEGYESAKGEIHPPKVLKYDAAKVLTTLSPTEDESAQLYASMHGKPCTCVHGCWA